MENRKKYAVIWFYQANHGKSEVWAENEQEAIKLVWGADPLLEYFVCEVENLVHFPSKKVEETEEGEEE